MGLLVVAEQLLLFILKTRAIGCRNSIWDPSAVPSHSPELLRRTGREPGEASWDPREQQG